MSNPEAQTETEAPKTETLEKLQSSYETINAFKRLTREAESKLWARVYMWWREVSSDPSYLPTVFEQNHIIFYSLRSINFRPVLKLVSRNEITNSDLDIWSSTLKMVHEDFERNPAHYAHDPIDAIAHYIKTEGGKTGVREKWSLPDLDSDDDVEVGLFELDDIEFRPLFKEGYERFFSNAAFPSIPSSLPATIDRSGYSVVLIKRDESGVVCLGSSADRGCPIFCVNGVLINSGRVDPQTQC